MLFKGSLLAAATSIGMIFAGCPPASDHPASDHQAGVHQEWLAQYPERHSALDEQDLEAFAVVATEVQSVKRKLIRAMLVAYRLGDEIAPHEEQALAEMEAVVAKNGLSVDRYNRIALLIEADPRVRTRLDAQLRQRDDEEDRSLPPSESGS